MKIINGGDKMKIKIPNYNTFNLNKLAFDFNGTLATGGEVPEKIIKRLEKLTNDFEIYILTADTFGTVREMVADLAVEVAIIEGDDGTGFKRDFIKELGSAETIAIGNGNNDRLMVEEAAIGIAIIGNEGAAIDTILNSDLIINNIFNVFELLEEPARLIASLRK